MKTRSLFYRKHIEGAMTAPIVNTRISEDVMAKFDRIMGDEVRRNDRVVVAATNDNTGISEDVMAKFDRIMGD